MGQIANQMALELLLKMKATIKEKREEKNKINLILYILIFLFAGIVIFVACKQSNQAIPAMSLQLKFVGEYSQNGEDWKALSEDTELSSFD